jgi:hypothetical protein
LNFLFAFAALTLGRPQHLNNHFCFLNALRGCCSIRIFGLLSPHHEGGQWCSMHISKSGWNEGSFKNAYTRTDFQSIVHNIVIEHSFLANLKENVTPNGFRAKA